MILIYLCAEEYHYSNLNYIVVISLCPAGLKLDMVKKQTVIQWLAKKSEFTQ